MKKIYRNFLAIFLGAMQITLSTHGYAQSQNQIMVSPRNIIPNAASEFFPVDNERRVLVRVNIWGEVSKPGVYYVPENSKLSYALGLAGGPNGMASLPDITQIREGKESPIDIVRRGDFELIKGEDTYYVDRSFWRADLSPTLSIVSTTLAVLMAYVSIQRNR